MNPKEIAAVLLEAGQDPEQIRRIARRGVEHVHLKDALTEFLTSRGLEVVSFMHGGLPGGRPKGCLVWARKGTAKYERAWELRTDLKAWLAKELPGYSVGWCGHRLDASGNGPLDPE